MFSIAHLIRLRTVIMNLTSATNTSTNICSVNSMSASGNHTEGTSPEYLSLGFQTFRLTLFIGYDWVHPPCCWLSSSSSALSWFQLFCCLKLICSDVNLTLGWFLYRCPSELFYLFASKALKGEELEYSRLNFIAKFCASIIYFYETCCTFFKPNSCLMTINYGM